MASIGGPGGIGGPKGPRGPSSVDGPDDVADASEVADTSQVADARAIGPGELDALASDLAAGKLTPDEVIDRLVAEAGAGLPHAEQAELREILTDLVANDPYLQSLTGRM